MSLLGIRISPKQTTITLFKSEFVVESSRSIEIKDYLLLDQFCEELIHTVALFRNQSGRVSIDCVSIIFCQHHLSELADWVMELTEQPILKTQFGRRLTELFATPLFLLPETQAAAFFCWYRQFRRKSNTLALNLDHLNDAAIVQNGRILPFPGNLSSNIFAHPPHEEEPLTGESLNQMIEAVFQRCVFLDQFFKPAHFILLGTDYSRTTLCYRQLLASFEQRKTVSVQFELSVPPVENVFELASAIPAFIAGYRDEPSLGPTARAQLTEMIFCGEKLLRSVELVQRIDEISSHIVECLGQGNKILTCGNGGSATDAAHLAEELVGKYRNPRRSYPAINLAADSSTLTCIGNDFGFENIFSRQVEGLGEYGDILVVFSTSGNSENILRALQAAKQKKLFSIALLGKDGGKALDLADLSIIIPSSQSERIQEYHTFVLHAICEAVENRLG